MKFHHRDERRMKVNVWLFPLTDEILVTDQTGGVPVDCCNLPEHESKRLESLTGSSSVLYDFESWEDAVMFAQSLRYNKLTSWTIQFDSEAGRELEFED